MALWDTFTWSDGTLWGDASGESDAYTSFIDRSGYHVSLRITHTNETWPGSLASFILQTVSAELGVRPQLPSGHEAFIDRNENTQRISVRVSHTAVAETDPFTIGLIHGLILPRSKRQPTG